mmetsp:Transcript_647/g.1833  ORF Transcript_647/g.1833 Transcript_647/m.1833 type:complete len:217 (-) Transcript_647:34-684(-)
MRGRLEKNATASTEEGQEEGVFEEAEDEGGRVVAAERDGRGQVDGEHAEAVGEEDVRQEAVADDGDVREVVGQCGAEVREAVRFFAGVADDAQAEGLLRALGAAALKVVGRADGVRQNDAVLPAEDGDGVRDGCRGLRGRLVRVGRRQGVVLVEDHCAEPGGVERGAVEVRDRVEGDVRHEKRRLPQRRAEVPQRLHVERLQRQRAACDDHEKKTS